MKENRASSRRRIKEWAKIIHDDGQRILNCTVTDVSATGARLIVGTADLPRTFYLYRRIDKSLREASIVRWSFQSVGVRLAPPIDLKSERARKLLAGLELQGRI
jgi:hypothetical protein